MSKPIIVITADSIVEPSAIINQVYADFAPRDLKEAVIKAGGIPIILPFPDDEKLGQEMAEALVSSFDGLIIPGGPDVDPTWFGEDPIRELGRTAYQRDAFEIPLVKAAKKAKKPIFGICRGLQVINVAFGGDLYQDLAKQNPDSYMKHSQLAPGGFPTHYVTVDSKSVFYSVLGEKSYVNSRHHQGVRKVADGFEATAVAADGVVEAIETSDGLVSAVQWHPENMWRADEKQFEVFKQFVSKC
ncbi:hypothetical protein HMPREF9318_01920 [Streptococcus urinalis FB127-CNA-2]|uniref:Peptidase C26 n=1 Tax=Streptococcus urinalis 2285-97 TaxID=764291 RepID=G5KDB4_9STRE|nr:gamma-glutamyl-gamma-aminobutyrate hydrolase family protein [Streptococcus urinalis]EHJ56503.1 peptidase C26 [Streptococcus urinalis 2285-97]EKS17471.1 hypothetical protein HMPREF9318_01920 [Streptococcus urinalis FB127-CNA-2]VEF32707.1 glutamine amidotransferase, class I [Streptococcus urinalis]